MSARNTPLVPQPTGDTQYNVRDAALHGASSAFSKPSVKPKPQANTYTGGGNGALLAAVKVGTSGALRTPASYSGTQTPLSRDWTGGSARSAARSHASPMQPLSGSSSSSTIAVYEESSAELVPSPSNIAAKLAAARHSPIRPLLQATDTPIMSERETNERDMFPPPGSVGNVLAKLSSKHQTHVKGKRRDEIKGDPIAVARALHAGLDKPTDETPIAPTDSLVTMFEQPRPVVRTGRTLVPSPKPRRATNLPSEPHHGEPLSRHRTKTPPPVKPKPKPLLEPVHPTDNKIKNTNIKNVQKNTSAAPHPARNTLQRVALDPVNAPPGPPPEQESHSHTASEDVPRPVSHHSRRLSSSLSHGDDPSSPSSFVSAQETQDDRPKYKPTPPEPRRSAKPKHTAAEPDSQTATPKLPASPTRARAQSKPTSPFPPPTRFTPPRRASVSGTSTPTGSVYHSNYQRESARAITKHMTGESLSSAIMGAALASSRNVSPARPYSPYDSYTATPSLPARRHHFTHSPFGRSPSPPKAKHPTSGKLRTTMRKDPSSSDDEEEGERYKRKGTRIMGLGRKHPNKHHEGTRKRWRDQITERERKRYEGVWAANRGLFISTPSTPAPSGARDSLRVLPNPTDEDASSDILDLVAKDIWARSRLPEHVLEEVWDLVDGRAIGRLRREEFVVGLWLIDQRLKGRKLPIKVSDSVWGSVRGATGVKVKVGDAHSHKPHKPHVVKRN